MQSESAECGLACLATICRLHGIRVALSDLRRRFSIGLRGSNLHQIIRQAAVLGFSSRAVRLEVQELENLRLPSILHWNLNHFVVLERVRGDRIDIIDPAVGPRRLSRKELCASFTGVALELVRNADFAAAQIPSRKLKLKELTGAVTGLRRSLLQIFLLAAAIELFAVVAPMLQQMVVDDVLAGGDRDLLTVLVLGFALLFVIQTALGFARSFMILLLSQDLSLQWTGNVFAHLMRLPIEFFEKRHVGDILSRFGSVEAIKATLTTAAIGAVLDALMASVALTLMLFYSVKLTVVTVGAVFLYGMIRWIAYQPFREAATERLIVAAKQSTHLLETLRAVTALKLFGREQERALHWKNLVVEVQNRDLRTARMSLAFGTANTLVFGLENIIILWLGAKIVIDSAANVSAAPDTVMTIGMLFAFISYKNQFSSRFSTVINFAVDLKMLALHAERLADICLEPPEKDDVPTSDLSHLSPSIELKGVSFRYGDGEPWILQDANFKIEAGESVAIVGASGAGKTTLLKIALGLLKPIEGEVFYGGQPVRQLGISNYRRQIGTVMQEDVLLTGSLADNIAFFDVQMDQVRIEACARLAQLHDDICRMPMGYQTLVGDLGSGLSGGQKQRLLLARALYKQPRVLALDEATSDLDIGNERAVTAALSQLALTRLIVAHRPETIAGARRVVQLVNGQVMEVARAVSNVPPIANPFPVLD